MKYGFENQISLSNEMLEWRYHAGVGPKVSEAKKHLTMEPHKGREL